MIATIQPNNNQNNKDQRIQQQYSCSHCGIDFSSEQLYKFHYKSELHKYNLKRRILDLPAISEQQFNYQFNREQSETSVHSNMMYCIPCGKQFATGNTLKQHLKSKKHKERIASNAWKNKAQQQNQHLKDSESDTSASKIHEKPKLSNQDVSVCLFCDQKAQNVHKNLEHMKNTHGFFIVQEEFISNIKGLIHHLGTIINDQMVCISCETEFKSIEGLKKHMIDKQHCFMQKLSVENSDYLAFYDFTLQKKVIELSEEEYSDNDESDDQQDNKNNNCQNDDIMSDFEMEGVEKFDKLSEKEMEEKKMQFMNYISKIRSGVTLNDNGEIQLANGKVIGHRQYKQYYKMYYTDIQEFNKKIHQKMIGDSSSNFKLRQNAITFEELEEVDEKELKLQRKEFIKQQKVDENKGKNNKKEKSKFGSDKMNSKFILVSGKKQDSNM